MSYSWTQPVCELCYAETHPGQEPFKFKIAEPEICCICGQPTHSGIYSRFDPQTVPHATREEVGMIILKIDGRDLARARDEYFASEEGKRMLNDGLLAKPEFVRFLKNRLAAAFCAGANAAERILQGEAAKLGGFPE